MTEWMTAHPWMTLAVLLALADSFRFLVRLRRRWAAVNARPEQAEPPITPDQAREHMRTPRRRAAKTIREQVTMFCDEGNPDVAMTLLYDAGDKAMLGHLLEYQQLGWRVEFHRDYATMSLPAVLS
jgi:hypothetical protein